MKKMVDKLRRSWKKGLRGEVGIIGAITAIFLPVMEIPQIAIYIERINMLKTSILIIPVTMIVIVVIARTWKGWNDIATAQMKSEPSIQVKVVEGNILEVAEKEEGITVIGTNDRWQWSLMSEGGLIAESSLQGQVTKRWFGGSRNVERKAGEANGKKELGDTRLTEANGKKVLWVVMSRWDHQTGAFKTTVPELEQAMTGLWESLRRVHNFDEAVFCPVIGAKFGKVPDESTANLLKRHIRSFVAATKEQKLTQTITFVVCRDEACKMDEEDLRDFVQAECRRETLREAAPGVEGTGIGV